MNDLTFWESLFCTFLGLITGSLAVSTNNIFLAVVLFLPFFVSMSKRKKRELK